MVCGHYIQVGVTDNTACCLSTADFCECKNSNVIWETAVAQGGFHSGYKFIPHNQIDCCNDTLRLWVTWSHKYICNCPCHGDEEWSDSDESSLSGCIVCKP